MGRTVADIYAINTFGGILGSLLGGFVLVKLMGLQPSLTVAALFLMAVGGPLAMVLARPWGEGTAVGRRAGDGGGGGGAGVRSIPASIRSSSSQDGVRSPAATMSAAWPGRRSM